MSFYTWDAALLPAEVRFNVSGTSLFCLHIERHNSGSIYMKHFLWKIMYCLFVLTGKTTCCSTHHSDEERYSLFFLIVWLVVFFFPINTLMRQAPSSGSAVSRIVPLKTCRVCARISVCQWQWPSVRPSVQASHRILGIISPTPVMVSSSSRSRWILTAIASRWKIRSTETSAQTEEVRVGQRAVLLLFRRNKKSKRLSVPYFLNLQDLLWFDYVSFLFFSPKVINK